MDTGCGSGGHCGCSDGASAAIGDMPPIDVSHFSRRATVTQLAQVNGIALHAVGEGIEAQTLRQRACSELLRQEAQRCGLLDATDSTSPEGALTLAASNAIEALLDRVLPLPEPSDEACRRYHAAHLARYSRGERVLARHILFAVVAGVDVVALRQRAEAVLLDLRCHDGDPLRADTAFKAAAGQWSNCPSGVSGGMLGWLTTTDCAQEFARPLFGSAEIGVMPQLVHSRFGLHIVEVLAREAGLPQAFEAVRGAVLLALQQQTYITALRQYLSVLAGQAELIGVALGSVETPLVQ